MMSCLRMYGKLYGIVITILVKSIGKKWTRRFRIQIGMPIFYSEEIYNEMLLAIRLLCLFLRYEF